MRWRSEFSKPFLLTYGIPLVLLLTVSLNGGPAAADGLCTYDAGTKTVTLSTTGPGYQLRVTVAGEIWQANSPCGSATVTNTDTIVINASKGDYSRSGVSIELRAPGTFAPGFTNEAGSSDEIEFVVNYLQPNFKGNYLFLRYSGPWGSTTDRVSVVLGGNQINLNANESDGVSDGVDADVTINGMSAGRVTITSGLHQSSGVDNFVGARGGSGTPSTPFIRPITALGGPGTDLFVGGPRLDRFWGYSGVDVLLGGDGNDEIRGGYGADHLDGEGGRDQVFGGPGNDTARGGAGADNLSGGRDRDELYGQAGDDFCNGGKGHDRCRGGPGRDTFKSCEVKQQ